MLYPFFRTGITQAIATTLNNCDLVLLEDDTPILEYTGLSAFVADGDAVAVATNGQVATALADTTNGINRIQIRSGSPLTVSPGNQSDTTELFTIASHGIPVNYPQPAIISGGIPTTVPAIASGDLIWLAYNTADTLELQQFDGTISDLNYPGYSQLNITAVAGSDTIVTPVLMDFRNETINILPEDQTPGDSYPFYTENARVLQQGEMLIAGGDIPVFSPAIASGQALFVRTNNALRGRNFTLRATQGRPDLTLSSASAGNFTLSRTLAVGNSSSTAFIKLDQADTQVALGTEITLNLNTVIYTGRSAAINNVY